MTLTQPEYDTYRQRLLTIHTKSAVNDVLNRIICQDLYEVLGLLPENFVDLLIIDPPYNLYKRFGNAAFYEKSDDAYAEWVTSWLVPLKATLTETASIYICGDWRTSPMLYRVIKAHFIVRNRITWERDKGRGAKANWKNNSEDIWFCTVGENYTFNLDAVKLKRRVNAPYRHQDGNPKDWDESPNGNFRLTHPSNLWTDITVPFWSMPENTDHPTQKSEKLLAKLILASSNPGDVVLDPFLGSGTSAVVAKKLGRRYVGIEIDDGYCCLAEKRLELAENDTRIQGYEDGVFWDRNVY